MTITLHIPTGFWTGVILGILVTLTGIGAVKLWRWLKDFTLFPA